MLKQLSLIGLLGLTACDPWATPAGRDQEILDFRAKAAAQEDLIAIGHAKAALTIAKIDAETDKIKLAIAVAENKAIEGSVKDKNHLASWQVSTVHSTDSALDVNVRSDACGGSCSCQVSPYGQVSNGGN